MPTTFAPPGRQASPEELTARRSSWPSELPQSGVALFARPQVRGGRPLGSSNFWLHPPCKRGMQHRPQKIVPSNATPESLLPGCLQVADQDVLAGCLAGCLGVQQMQMLRRAAPYPASGNSGHGRAGLFAQNGMQDTNGEALLSPTWLLP